MTETSRGGDSPVAISKDTCVSAIGMRVGEAFQAEGSVGMCNRSSAVPLARSWGCISSEVQIVPEAGLLYKIGFGRLSALPLNAY